MSADTYVPASVVAPGPRYSRPTGGERRRDGNALPQTFYIYDSTEKSIVVAMVVSACEYVALDRTTLHWLVTRAAVLARPLPC